MKMGATGVPTFLIGDDVIVGLDRNRVLGLVDHQLISCEKCGTKLRVPKDKGTLKVTCSKCQNKFIVST